MLYSIGLNNIMFMIFKIDFVRIGITPMVQDKSIFYKWYIQAVFFNILSFFVHGIQQNLKKLENNLNSI